MDRLDIRHCRPTWMTMMMMKFFFRFRVLLIRIFFVMIFNIFLFFTSLFLWCWFAGSRLIWAVINGKSETSLNHFFSYFFHILIKCKYKFMINIIFFCSPVYIFCFCRKKNERIVKSFASWMTEIFFSIIFISIRKKRMQWNRREAGEERKKNWMFSLASN